MSAFKIMTTLAFLAFPIYGSAYGLMDHGQSTYEVVFTTHDRPDNFLIYKSKDEKDCVKAGDLIRAWGPDYSSVLPCSVADELFLFGFYGKKKPSSTSGDVVIVPDFYAIFRMYLAQKRESGRSAFEAGNVGLLVVGLAAVGYSKDESKAKLYEAYSIHQLGISALDLVDESGVSGDSVAEIFNKYFWESLSAIGVPDLGTLVCAVQFDSIDLSLQQLLNTKALHECVRNEGNI